MKIAFVTNICPHYRVKTFETLAKYYHALEFYFFSAGDEWYWQQQHGVRTGQFNHQYLKGFSLSGTRLTPALFTKLIQGNYDVYIKCINGRFALPITYLAARLRRKPFILWTGIWVRLQTPAHRLMYPFTRYIYRHSDAIVVYGEHVKHYLNGEEGVPAERIFVAAHAVDNPAYNGEVSADDRAQLRRELRIEESQKIILYLGRLEEIKGLPYLLEAFALLKRKDTVLVFAGTGSELELLQKLARELGVEQLVRFTGYIPPEKTQTYYATAWVYVLPSVTLPQGRELWGLVVNEAFNQGLPVIASEAVGAAAGGMVQDGKTGLVVPERDPVALSLAMKRILDDEPLRARMSTSAKEIVAGWDNECMVQGFRQAIDYVTCPK